MANPQKENGYTAIANELLEALMKINLSAHESRIVLCIIRYSYGWNRKGARISLSQIERVTGIPVKHVARTIKKLIHRRIFNVARKGRVNIYFLQKDYEKWRYSLFRESTYRESPKRGRSTPRTGSEILPKEGVPMSLKSSNGNGSHGAKDIYKEIYKDISLRERILLKLKTYFSKLSVPDSVPTERIDYFLYLIETGGIKAERIDSPVAYMMSSKLEIVPFPSLPEREEDDWKKKAEELEKIRKEREEVQQNKLKREDITEDKKLLKEISSLHKRLGINSEYTRI